MKGYQCHFVHIRVYMDMFLLKERSDGGGTISRLFGSLSVRNKRRRQYHRNAFLFKKKTGKKISNQIATFDLSRISRTSEGGRPNAPKIATRILSLSRS